MEILLWLLPAAVVTTLAMAWAGWAGREGRGEVDRDAAVRRLAQALEQPRPAPRTPPTTRRLPDRSTGVVVRPAQPARHDRAS